MPKKAQPQADTPVNPTVAPVVPPVEKPEVKTSELPNPPPLENPETTTAPKKVVARILEEGEMPPPVMDEGSPIRVTEENGVRRLDY